MTKRKGKARKRSLGAELLKAVQDMAAGRWARKTEFIRVRTGPFYAA